MYSVRNTIVDIDLVKTFKFEVLELPIKSQLQFKVCKSHCIKDIFNTLFVITQFKIVDFYVFETF